MNVFAANNVQGQIQPEKWKENGVSFHDLFMSLSTALDLVNIRFGNHHKLTCYIALRIHQGISSDIQEYEKLFASALVHDIGASFLFDRETIHEFELKHPDNHALIGESVLETVEPLSPLASVIGDHHVLWDEGRGSHHRKREVSILSHIIQLADSIAVLIDQSSPMLGQAVQIRDNVKSKSGRMFSPVLVEAFCDISSRHEFWLDMDAAFIDASISRLSSNSDRQLTFDELEKLSKVYAFIIDSRSRFTAKHSSGVAVVAQSLALAHGLNEEQSLKVKIAGYLHDIGKLSVPGQILEKSAELDEDERLVMSGHSFYTQKILRKVRGMEQISLWATQHHEFIDGSGYPYGLCSDQLSIESRILTIADIFTALTETRPYREGLGLGTCLGMLENFYERGKIDSDVLETLKNNAIEINLIRRCAQNTEDSILDEFRDRVSEKLECGMAKEH